MERYYKFRPEVRSEEGMVEELRQADVRACVIAWDAVGETEGTGIVHIAPGCGKEDFALGKEHHLVAVAPLDEAGVFLPGFEDLTGKSAIDETTNLVARLQAIAEPNSLVISPVTYRLVGALFDYRDLGRRTLKGFPDTVRVRQVLGPSKVESRFEAQHQSGTSPLLGREEELELLLRRWEQAKRAEGRVVLVTGEPGIGKSRIARALRDRLTSDPHTSLS